MVKWRCKVAPVYTKLSAVERGFKTQFLPFENIL